MKTPMVDKPNGLFFPYAIMSGVPKQTNTFSNSPPV